MLFSQQLTGLKHAISRTKEQDEDEDEREYWYEALRTLKLPSFCHGHSVKGPGLVAMARDDAPCSCAVRSCGHHPHLPEPSQAKVHPQCNPGSAHTSPGALSWRFITAQRSEGTYGCVWHLAWFSLSLSAPLSAAARCQPVCSPGPMHMLPGDCGRTQLTAALRCTVWGARARPPASGHGLATVA
jgi:hypothetical protein